MSSALLAFRFATQNDTVIPTNRWLKLFEKQKREGTRPFYDDMTPLPHPHEQLSTLGRGKREMKEAAMIHSYPTPALPLFQQKRGKKNKIGHTRKVPQCLLMG